MKFKFAHNNFNVTNLQKSLRFYAYIAAVNRIGQKASAWIVTLVNR